MKFSIYRLAFGCCVAASAMAANAQNPYFLLSTGNSTYSGNMQTETDASLAAWGQTGISSTINTRSTGYKAMLGYQLTPTISVEGGYLDLGTFPYSASYAAGALNTDFKATGLNISAVNFFPINSEISLFGKLGMSYLTVKGVGSTGAVSASTSQDKTSLGFGLGATYSLTEKLSLRTEWERPYNDINLLSLGLQVRF
jgi:opacity protein-like surface antigen